MAFEETKVKADEANAAAEAAADKRWREAFEPHVIILTELTVPSQITICGLVRGERGRWIDVDVSSPRETFIRQAMDEQGGKSGGAGLMFRSLAPRWVS
jgi:hypothetical protein